MVEKEFKAELVSLANIDKGTKILTVMVFETVRGWFSSKTTSKERTFTYIDGLWLDERFRSVTNVSITWRLQEMLVTHMAEHRLDRYIATL